MLVKEIMQICMIVIEIMQICAFCVSLPTHRQVGEAGNGAHGGGFEVVLIQQQHRQPRQGLQRLQPLRETLQG